MRPHRPCRVLVVESSSTDIQDMLAGCRRLQLDLRVATTLAGAVAQVEASRPALVVLDLERPDARGLDDLGTLLQVQPDLAILLVTGVEDARLADEAVSRGAQDCLVRAHLNPDMLGRVARHAIERQRLTSGLRAAVERLHRSEARLREAKGRLSAILGAVPLAVLQLDRTGRVLMVSRLPGFAGDGVTPGTKLTDHLPLEGGARLQWHLHQAVLHRTEQRIELVATGPDGRRGTWVVHLSPILSPDGEVSSLTATFRDVTAERLLADRVAQSDRMATVGILAASLTAEINNPMTAVLANVQAMQDTLAHLAAAARQDAPADAPWLDELQTDLPEMADDMAAGAERVQRIVADLHRYAEVTERFEVVIEPSRALRAAIGLARPQMGDDVAISTQLGATPPVRVDESRFTQVIAELLANAAQAMSHLPPREQRIEVGLRAANGAALLTVRDHGRGVPEADRTHIFEPFFTGRAADGAAGIGLAVARRMVTAWGGTLEVDSHPDGGALFSVLLPSAAPSEAARTRRAHARQGHAATPVPPRGRVVLVGADPARREQLRRALAADHEVIAVADMASAQETLSVSLRPDAVLVDVASSGRGIEDFDSWLGTHAPELLDRVAWVAPTAPTSAQRMALAGRSARVVNADAGPDALRRLIGRLLAA
ncbi:MAG: ATP-binding protein [Myxococcota bacterium]|nr:ATP-binding protein [Myxococcota bacterium]MEC8423835.1 ATP-binding protein [Myxococcota bacterium]